ncbi:MAG: DMT family transporter [Thermodesulfobacteriota bacterium]
MPSGFTGYLFILAAALMWGTTGTFAKILFLQHLSYLQVSFLRSAVAFLILFCAHMGSRRRQLKVASRDIPLLLAIGVTHTLFSLSYLRTIQLSSITQAVFLLYTYPIFVTVVARLFLKELLSTTKLMALGGSVVGVILLTQVFNPAGLSMPWPAVVSGLTASLIWTCSMIMLKLALRKYPAWTVLFFVLAFSTLFLTIITKPGSFLLSMSVTGWLGAIGLGTCSTLAGVSFFYKGLRRVEASRASILATLEPVVASSLGFIIFAETLPWSGFLGSGFILLGAILVQV